MISMGKRNTAVTDVNALELMLSCANQSILSHYIKAKQTIVYSLTEHQALPTVWLNSNWSYDTYK